MAISPKFATLLGGEITWLETQKPKPAQPCSETSLIGGNEADSDALVKRAIVSAEVIRENYALLKGKPDRKKIRGLGQEV